MSQDHRLMKMDEVEIPSAGDFGVGSCRFSTENVMGGFYFSKETMSGTTKQTMVQITENNTLKYYPCEEKFTSAVNVTTSFLFFNKYVVHGRTGSTIIVFRIEDGKIHRLYDVRPKNREITALERYEDDKFFYGTNESGNFLGVCDITDETSTLIRSTNRNTEYEKTVTCIRKGRSDKVAFACRLYRKERKRPYYRRRKHVAVYLYRVVKSYQTGKVKLMRFLGSKVLETKTRDVECPSKYVTLEFFTKHGHEYIFFTPQIGYVCILNIFCKVIKFVKYPSCDLEHPSTSISPTMMKINRSMFICGILGTKEVGDMNIFSFDLQKNEFYEHQDQRMFRDARIVCKVDRNRFLLFKGDDHEINRSPDGLKKITRCELWMIENTSENDISYLDLMDRLQFLDESFTFNIVFSDDTSISSWLLRIIFYSRINDSWCVQSDTATNLLYQ